MTRKEKERLAVAVRLLFADDWIEGMKILLPMAGLHCGIQDLGNFKPVPLEKIAGGPNRKFRYMMRNRKIVT